jgi:hypothetical protein
MIDFEKMDTKELKVLKVSIDKELEKRKRLEYDKLLEKFTDVLYELYDKFPNESCFTDGETWEDLYQDNNWNF